MRHRLYIADEQLYAERRKLLVVTDADRYAALLAFGVKDSVAAAVAANLITVRVRMT